MNVAKLDLADGTVTVGSMTGARKPIVYDKVNVAVRNFSFTTAFPVTASVGLPGGGSLKIDGTAGPINATDTTLTPVKATVGMKKLDLAQSALVDPALGITVGRFRWHGDFRWQHREGQRNLESDVVETGSQGLPGRSTCAGCIRG